MKATAVPIEHYMTASPHTIGAEQMLSAARELMRKHGVRHLPVLHGGRVVGLLSARDIDFVASSLEIDPGLVPVSEAMVEDPYVVAPGTPLDEVALEMSRRRYGSAVILDGKKVLGIFTTVDGMRLLGETLRRARAAEMPVPPPSPAHTAKRRVAARPRSVR